MKLIPEWRSALKMFSVQANLLGVTMTSVYTTMYANLKDTIPPTTMGWITGSVFILAVIARLIDQELATKEDDAA